MGSRTALLVGDKVVSTDQSGQAAFWLRANSLLDRGILHLLRSHVSACESIYPGSGETCISVAAGCLSLWKRRERAGERPEDISQRFLSSIDALSSTSSRKRRLRVDDLDEMLDRVPLEIRGKLRAFLESAPLGTTVSVKKGNGYVSSVDRKNGASIRVGPDSRHMGVESVVDPTIVLFDGVIDSVAQIHRLLSDSSETGRSYVLGGRGFAPEVVNTLRVNVQRGTISVLAFSSRIDDLTVGSLDDFAAYTGSWVINSQSGESISSAFDRLTSAKGKFWIESDHLRTASIPCESVQKHLATLRRDASTGDQSISDFLVPRILGLSASRIEVMLGASDIMSSPTLLEAIDSDMRSTVSSFTRGVSRGIDIPLCLDPQIAEVIRDADSKRLRSAGSALAGVISGIRFARDINSIGHAVVL